jgi:hypothetical protein
MVIFLNGYQYYVELYIPFIIRGPPSSTKMLIHGKTPSSQRGEIARTRPQLGLYSFGMKILTGMWAQLPLRGFTPGEESSIKALLSYYVEKKRTNLTLF